MKKERHILELTATISISLIVFALAYFIIRSNVLFALKKYKTGTVELNLKKTPCPVCGSMIKEGDRVKTAAYSLGREKLVLLYGCPSCYPPGKAVKRICPVCKNELGGKGYVLGKMWEEGKKLRLHIIGCSVCKPNYFTVKN